MTLTIELKPAVEARLKERAAREGRPEAEIAAEALERALAGEAAPRRSILDFEGVGAHAATGQDAQEYVNELRKEWDNRP